MTTSHPLVSVLMPVYNGERYLREAIESILNQTFQNFEFLIINDGSTDQSVEIMLSYSDPRIILFHHQKKRGLIGTLNEGLRLAKGKYIARMDCDDISLPERFSQQVAFMEANPEIGICGTWAQTFDGRSELWQRPTDDHVIRCHLLFNCVMNHPTVMLRRDIIIHNKLYYDPLYVDVEDFELWVRGAAYTKLANMNKVFVHYRIHSNQITARTYHDKFPRMRHIFKNQIKRLGIAPTEEELDVHQALKKWDIPIGKSFVEAVDAWLCKLIQANAQRHLYADSVLSDLLGRYWYGVCSLNTKFGIWTWRRFWQSQLSRSIGMPLKTKLSFLVRCVIQKSC